MRSVVAGVPVPVGRPVWRRRFLSVAAASLLALSLSGCDLQSINPVAQNEARFNGVDITGAEYARALSLPDGTGRVRSLEEFRGKVVIVLFGFTQCPDICPTSMAEVSEVRKRLGPSGENVQGVFVSIDPERDTAEVVAEYVRSMDPSFVGLRGSVDQVTQAAKEFKVFFQKVPSQDGKSYTMDHTAGAYVFDRDGRVRLFVRYGMGLDALTADIRRLLEEKA